VVNICNTYGWELPGKIPGGGKNLGKFKITVLPQSGSYSDTNIFLSEKLLDIIQHKNHCFTRQQFCHIIFNKRDFQIVNCKGVGDNIACTTCTSIWQFSLEMQQTHFLPKASSISNENKNFKKNSIHVPAIFIKVSLHLDQQILLFLFSADN
jgi:hypothetical protein